MKALIIALLVAFAAAFAVPSLTAFAQPGHEGHNHGPGAHGKQPTRDANAKAAAKVDDAPKGFTNADGKPANKSAALLFWVLAAMTIGGALFVITRRNMVTAVMGMVGTFLALSGLYAMLYAHFLAVIQILVYAGAIMVLFVFVIMILNRPEDDPWSVQGIFGKAIAGLSLGYLVYRLAGVLWTVKDGEHATEAPITPGGFEFGSTKAVGKVLFTDYLFPFEAVSIVLLVSVVGAIAIARPKKAEDVPDDNSDDKSGDEGAEA